SAGEAWEHSQRVTSLPDAHAANIGDTVTVSGSIAKETRLLRKDFVAYRRNQTQGAYRNATRIVTIDSNKQPLAIDTSGGRIQIINNDYRFEDEHVDWAAAEVLDTPAGFAEGAITILGFKRSSPILAMGVVTGVGDEVLVKAEFLVAGPRETYLERLADASESRLGTVVTVAIIGLLLLLYAFWDLRRIFRE
ncbi:unnamed protein product, partial [Discosporangium mesarthrocarpum]